MMDNPEYASPACRKIKTYCDNGIIPSINLIMTYETSACPIGNDTFDIMNAKLFARKDADFAECIECAKHMI